MKAIIIEDEKLSADHLALLLRKIDPSIEIIATADSVKRSLELFSKGIMADILFIDVHLADGLSFEIFSKLNIEIPVIFTTAFDEYAIQAFKLNSIDYLLKPIGIDDLKTALTKYQKLKSVYQTTIIEDITNAYQNLNKQYKNRFMVKSGDTIASIKTEEIAHFISEDSLVILVTTSGKKYSVDYTLDDLETLIAPDLFFRINRKVIIHINTIQKANSYFNSRLKLNSASLSDDDCIVSRERVSDFKKWLDK
ncbi:DNA-binding response regulator [Bacteroidota bacterium]|nr:DNA-binding response regulator [Bacteroidota bacterium]